MNNKKTLYVLEKIWKFKPDIKLSQDDIDEILIRPCNVSYNVYRRFSLGLPTRCATIIHEGCALSWWPHDSGLHYANHPDFKSFEEFMIYANVNKNITPLIENWLVEYEYRTYFVKTIDLKKNEVLYDGQDKLLKKLSEQYLMKRI